jgi:hypothetical protein
MSFLGYEAFDWGSIVTKLNVKRVRMYDESILYCDEIEVRTVRVVCTLHAIE